MNPELPFLAAGGVAVVAATVRDGRLPNLSRPLIGICLVILIASATDGSKLAPLVRSIGLLVLLGAVIGGTRAIIEKEK